MVRLALLALVACVDACCAALIASSQIEQCVRTGAEDELQCEENKFVVAISVENGQNGTETVEAVMTAVEGDDGEQRLEQPWSIVLRKSRVIIRYPISYQKSFNSRPREEVIYVSAFGCSDGALAGSPTCGFMTDDQGSIVPDSQGFCCDCSIWQTIGISDDQTRAGLLGCNLFSTHSSGHCLRMDELWYSSYAIGPAETHFTIELGVTGYRQDAETSENVRFQEVIELGPHEPGARSSDGKILARLIGDFARPTETPTLESKYLLVPSSPITHERVQAGTSAWMVVDRSRFTLDGTECNKIGVSHEAFRYETDRCTKYVGSCLGNQPHDLHESDEQLAREGHAGQYMISNFGDFRNVYDDTTENHFIAFAWPGMQASLLTLEMAADHVRFVTNNSPGEIHSAGVEPFESQSADGTMTVRFTNTGTITADYTVQVDCTDGAPDIKPVAAQKRTVHAYHTETVEFDLRSESVLSTDNVCKVELLDSLLTIVDTTDVTFSTREVEIDKGAQAGVGGNPGRAEEGVPGAGGRQQGASTLASATGSGSLCSGRCSGGFDIPCFLLFGCWEAILRLVIAIVAVVAVLLLLRLGWARRGAIRQALSSNRRGPVGSKKMPAPRDDENDCALKESSLSSAEDDTNGRPVIRQGESRPLRRQDIFGYKHESCAPPQYSHPIETEADLPTGRSARRDDAGSAICYLNLEGEQPGELDMPGEKYSLRGMSTIVGEQIHFCLGPRDQHQHWRFHAEQGRHVPLVPSRRIDKKAFDIEMSPFAALEHQVLSAGPRFPCVNVPWEANRGSACAQGDSLSV